jgi:precorrin-2/cobalt-factor-2 C20-methyltransferase
MSRGVLYGIGIGPGDPDLITVKGAKILSQCLDVFVPKAKISEKSTARAISEKHLHPEANIYELVFPMDTDNGRLRASWKEGAGRVAEVLEAGRDACFLTLGDTMLYSTYIYLVRALREILPKAEVVTVPGITAFSAAAAATEFPVGTGKRPVTIIPTSDDLEEVRRMLARPGVKVIMKIGQRCEQILELLEETGAIGDSVFISRVGLEDQRIERDLNKLRNGPPDTGYLSVILSGDGEKGERES